MMPSRNSPAAIAGEGVYPVWTGEPVPRAPLAAVPALQGTCPKCGGKVFKIGG